LSNGEIVFDLVFQLKTAGDTCFPTNMRSNTISYPEKYNLLKTKLGPKQDLVELMVAIRSLEKEIQNNTVNDELYDKIVLLNKHGKEHVKKVISCASDIAGCIVDNNVKLTPFEIFNLLCAIQIHDIGNIYGRENHTTSFKVDFDKYANESCITEGILRNCIFDIAKVHGGKINNDKDTVEAAHLRYKVVLFNEIVRQRFLAAILRFADELADDNTRTLDIDISMIPEYSKIYHAYSSSLRTAKIEKEEKEDAYFVKLCYFMTLQESLHSYKKLVKNENGKAVSISIQLIQEILERTIKMERERRYCSRSLLPYVIFKHIKVEIQIDVGSLVSAKMIEYTLRETGYPNENIMLPQSVNDDIAELEKMNALNRNYKPKFGCLYRILRFLRLMD
jgi:hypothetical protein